MLKKKKENISIERSHDLQAWWQGLVVAILMSLGSSGHRLSQSDESRLDPLSGGGKPITQHLFGLSSLRFRWECWVPPVGWWVSAGWGNAVSLCHPLRQSSCLFTQAQLSQLRPIFAHQQRWTPSGFMWLSQYFSIKGVITAWVRTKRQDTSRLCLFPYLRAWAGGLCWGSYCAHQQLPPERLSHQHSSLPSGIPCGYILLLGLANSSPLVLSQVPKPQLKFHGLPYLGRGGLWWWLQVNSCCFAVCCSGKKSSNDFNNI